MGYLLHIVLAILAQGAVESGLDLGLTWWPAIPLLLPAPYALARLARAQYMRGRFAAGGVLLWVLSWSPVGLHLMALALFGWLRAVEGWTGVSPELLSWPHPATLLGMAPFAACSLAAIDARARLTAATGPEIARTRRFHGRMFLSGLVPLALYVLLSWVLGWFPPLRAHIEHAAVWSALFASLLLLGMVFLLPRILRNTWETTPVQAGPLRDQLELLARRAGVRFSELLVWRTGNLMANAAVVGVSSSQRVVLFSDALLARLEPRELMAVFAHEMGHVKRHHVAIFIAWALVFFLGADLAGTWLDLAEPLHAGGILLGGLLLWYLGFGYLSRRFELEADLYSVELLEDVDAMVQALESVGGTHGRRLGSWRHFSTHDRVAFLRRCAADPGVAARLRHVLRRWSLIGVACAGIVVLLQARELAQQYDRDRVVVALSLGRYAAAAAHLQRLEAPEPELERLLQRVAPLADEGGEVAIGLLEADAEAALARGEPQAAVDLLRLASLRGRSALDEVAWALSSHAAGEEAGLSEATRRRLWLREPRWARILEERGAL